MTMPHLENCPHDSDGWCLDCVKELYDANEKLRFGGGMIADISSDQSKTIKWALKRCEDLTNERDRIRTQRNALREFEQRVSASLIEDGCGDEFWNAIQAAHNDYLEARKALEGLGEERT